MLQEEKVWGGGIKAKMWLGTKCPPPPQTQILGKRKGRKFKEIPFQQHPLYKVWKCCSRGSPITRLISDLQCLVLLPSRPGSGSCRMVLRSKMNSDPGGGHATRANATPASPRRSGRNHEAFRGDPRKQQQQHISSSSFSSVQYSGDILRAFQPSKSYT